MRFDPLMLLKINWQLIIVSLFEHFRWFNNVFVALSHSFVQSESLSYHCFKSLLEVKHTQSFSFSMSFTSRPLRFLLFKDSAYLKSSGCIFSHFLRPNTPQYQTVKIRSPQTHRTTKTCQGNNFKWINHIPREKGVRMWAGKLFFYYLFNLVNRWVSAKLKKKIHISLLNV